MKSSEDSYLLAEVKWAIAKNIGFVHPYIHMPDKNLFYDLFTHKLMAYHPRASYQFSRHYHNSMFECLDTEMVYCTILKDTEDLGDGFYFLPDYNDESDYWEFCGEVYNKCVDIYVNIKDLITFAEKIKKLGGIREEVMEFEACDDDPMYIPYRKRRSYKKAN